MSARKVKAGEAYVEITAKDKMAGTLNAAEKRLETFAAGAQAIGQSVAAVGAGLMAGGSAILGALAGAAKVFADTGDEINKMADRTGVAHEELSRWVHAANQSGASAKLLETALRNMAKKGADPRRFRDFAREINAIEDPALKVARAMELWGKAGAMMLPVIRDLEALSAEADALGLIITPEAAARATALGDAWSNLLRVGQDLAFELGDAVAEPLTRMIVAVASGVVAVASFVEKNQQLVVALAAMAAVAVAAGAVMVALGTALVGVAVVSQSLVAIYAALAAPFVLVGAGIAAIVAALLMGAGAWLVFSQAGQAALASLGQVLQGLVNAIAAGNLLNAWGQLGKAMQIVWQHTVNGIRSMFFAVIREVTEVLARTLEKFSGAFKAIPGYGKVAAKGLSAAAKGARGAADLGSKYSDKIGDQEIARLQAELDALRGLVAPEAATRIAAINIPRLSDMLDTSAAMGAGAGGGAAGTFSAAGAGLLGRSAPALEREAKEQTGLLKGIKDVLSDIDDGIDELEGFAMG